MQLKKPKLAALAVLASAYFITGKLGLALAYLHPSATAVWPPTGIALAALLLFGYELWPAILLGAFLVNITTTGSALVCLGIATGNTLEAVIGAWLVNRYARGRNAVYGTPDIFKFALFAGLFSTSIAATFGVTSLALGGYASWANYRAIWTTWWLGDAAGAILIAPLLILWISRPRLRWRRKQLFEAAAMFVCLVVVGLVVFDGVFDLAMKNYPLEYLCMPFLLWVAYRFGPREAASATVILSGTAIWGTLHGFGPFGRESHNESLLLLQTFLSVAGITTMGLATAFAERATAEERSHFLAVSDPLTGLGNYRKLIDTLEMEIRRSARTGRPFALLLLDMDDLKRINDTFGHLTGSRALCRLADALRVGSRNIDTAARFGGDEFALVVPELGPQLAQELWEDLGPQRVFRRSSESNADRGDAVKSQGERPRELKPDAAPNSALGYEILSGFSAQTTAGIVQHIANRISSHLADDGESPRLSVSIGAAQFPADGENIEQLLNAADQALYRNKREKRTGRTVSVSAPPSAPNVNTLLQGAKSAPAAVVPATAGPSTRPASPHDPDPKSSSEAKREESTGADLHEADHAVAAHGIATPRAARSHRRR